MFAVFVNCKPQLLQDPAISFNVIPATILDAISGVTAKEYGPDSISVKITEAGPRDIMKGDIDIVVLCPNLGRNLIQLLKLGLARTFRGMCGKRAMGTVKVYAADSDGVHF